LEPTRRHACHVAEAGVVRPSQRQLLVEEPLLIQIGGQPIATLMRTVGNEVELALGHLLTEGIIQSMDMVGTITFCQETREGANVVRVVPAEGAGLRPGAAPHRRVFSSCSVCGVEQIREVARDIRSFSPSAGRLTCGGITALASRMRERQALFEGTGASHAAALALRPLEAASLEQAIVREDIGRHNALDKAVGAAMRNGLDFGRGVLCVSSRLSFEMVAKAARAGIADVVGLSAPTTLAVELAQRLGMFLAGFARGETFTIYSGIEALEK
jgi:FdhD protein